MKYALVFNSTGSSQGYSISVQPAGGTNRTIFAGTLGNGLTFILPQPFTMDAGDILTVSGASASLVVAASGIEFTP